MWGVREKKLLRLRSERDNLDEKIKDQSGEKLRKKLDSVMSCVRSKKWLERMKQNWLILKKKLIDEGENVEMVYDTAISLIPEKKMIGGGKEEKVESHTFRLVTHSSLGNIKPTVSHNITHDEPTVSHSLSDAIGDIPDDNVPDIPDNIPEIKHRNTPPTNPHMFTHSRNNNVLSNLAARASDDQRNTCE